MNNSNSLAKLKVYLKTNTKKILQMMQSEYLLLFPRT